MSDLPLSLLSRGCGQFVSSGQHDGRLEVFFTLQDYFIWKSQDSLLRLSKSGHLLTEAEWTLPKTYSTRRGPLLLYSQTFATFESLHSEIRERKKKIIRLNTEEVEQQLSSLKELTAAILSYNDNQISADLHPSAPSPICTKPKQRSPDLPSQSNPQRVFSLDPAERNPTHLENQPEDKDEEHGSRKGVRLDLFLQISPRNRTPTPQSEPQPWVHYIAMTPEEPEEPQSDLDSDLHGNRRLKCTETNQSSAEEGMHHPNCEYDAAEGQDGSTQDKQKPEVNKNKDRVIIRTKQKRTVRNRSASWQSSPQPETNRKSGLFPSTTGRQTLSPRRFMKRTDGLRLESPCSDDHPALLLPPIAESRGETHAWPNKVQTHTKGNTVRFQPQENPKRLHQQPLSLPQLFPEPPPPAGLQGYVSGRRGPGKQSSLAFLQNQVQDLQDPKEQGREDRGVVRGVLPLELRDLQNGESVGCLIVGPDGEILKLSLYENSQDAAAGDGGSQKRALQVLSPEGEKLPWVVMVQPESTHAGGDENSTDLPVNDAQLSQFKHQISSAASFSPNSPRGPVMDSGKSGLKDARNSERTPPMTEQEREGDAVDEDDDKDGKDKHPGTVHGLHQLRSQTNDLGASTAEGAMEQPRTNTEEKDAAGATGKGDIKTGDRAPRAKKEGRSLKAKPGREAPSVKKQEERTHREAAETLERSVLHPDTKRKTAERKGEKGDVEEKEERADVSGRRRGSAKKRRGGTKHKDMVFGSTEGSPGKDVLEVNQEAEQKSPVGSSENPPASQRQPSPEGAPAETDKRSSVRSLSSLRSTAAASQSNLRSSRRSLASSCEGAGPASAVGQTSSHGRLSSCSTVMVTEEQLMLNPVIPELSSPRRSRRDDEEEEALRLAQRAERRRQEVERKRREREEEERRRQKREQTEDRMKNELEEERRRRAEEIRLKKEAEEEKRRKQEEEEQERARREQEQREREKRRQEERRRQMERFQQMREEEQQRREAELERLRLEEERRLEEENKKLQGMNEAEREEYLSRKEQEEEERRRRGEEAARQAAEEARLQAELLARQMALLQRQLDFRRGLMLEAGGLEKTQGISRPWVYSYFTLLQILGLNH